MPETIEAIFEHGVLRPLQPIGLSEGQRVLITLEPEAMTPAEAEAHLREWMSVYEGLTDGEIDDVEAVAFDRSSFSRHR